MLKKILFLIILLGLSTGCVKETMTKNDNNYSDSDQFVLFKLKMNAKEIYLAGNFNTWKVKDPIFQFKSKDNVNWELSLPQSKFKKGRNEYKLIVDGDWKVNPSDKVEDSALSGKINVFEIK